MLDIHTAAVGSDVAADGAAVHVERAADIHAAAAVVAVDVAADGAAVHRECAVFRHIHAWAALAALVEDSAAVDGVGSIVVLYPPAFVVFIELLGTLAAVAVGQGKGFAIGNVEDFNINIVFISRSRDTVPVQAELNIIVALPCCGKRHILGQVVVARQLGQTSVRFDVRVAVLSLCQCIRPCSESGFCILVMSHFIAGVTAAQVVLMRRISRF